MSWLVWETAGGFGVFEWLMEESLEGGEQGTIIEEEMCGLDTVF